MAPPELDVARVQRWCARQVPDHVRDQIRVECEVAARHVTIVERRPPWDASVGPEWSTLPFAQVRYATTTGAWTLYWCDRNSRFHLYDLVPPSQRISDLLDDIDRDPTCIFKG